MFTRCSTTVTPTVPPLTHLNGDNVQPEVLVLGSVSEKGQLIDNRMSVDGDGDLVEDTHKLVPNILNEKE